MKFHCFLQNIKLNPFSKLRNMPSARNNHKSKLRGNNNQLQQWLHEPLLLWENQNNIVTIMPLRIILPLMTFLFASHSIYSNEVNRHYD